MQSERKKMEEWKAIPGYEGHYEASSYGRIRSLERKCLTKDGFVRTAKARILKSFRRTDGYPAVNFTFNGRKQWSIAHLVLMAFVGPCSKGMESCHNDGDLWNNRICNLRWDTHFNNMLDRNKHGTIPRGEACNFSKLTRLEVVKIKIALGKDLSRGRFVRIAKRFRVSKRTIRDIYTGNTWGWLNTSEV